MSGTPENGRADRAAAGAGPAAPACEPDFGGTIGPTVANSTAWWPGEVAPGRPRPNVVLVILDDTGWADFGCFGSEIQTPTIDRLAGDGLRYTNFHVTPLCSPSRASLLTGRNHHQVGMRFLAHVDTGFPNSRGRVVKGAATLPEVLRGTGYSTFLVGKWHLAPKHETGPTGPHDNWPLGRGFEKFYGFLDGCTDQYAPELVQDNHIIEPPVRPGYHLSEDLVDHAIRYVTDQVAFHPAKPFFLQVAFGATHAPLQAPQRYVDKYVPVFAKGWDRTREDRLRRQKALGLLPADTQLTERNEGVPVWEELSEDERRLSVRLQAAYAGFLEHTDEQLGRLVDHLERLGILDDTLILVLSDNGASHEGGPSGGVSVHSSYLGIPRRLEDELAQMDEIGGPNGPSHYPEGWAMASNTPFRRYKRYVDAGGVRSPLVVRWPARARDRGGVRHQFAHAVDVMPTVLDLLGIEMPRGDTGIAALPLDGTSMAGTLDDPDAPPPRNAQYFEMFGHRAIWHAGWKAVAVHHPGQPYEADVWRLYHAERDPAECRDLAAALPAKLRELQDLWWREAARNNVLPLDDRSMRALLDASTPGATFSHASFVFYPGQSHLPTYSGLNGTNRPVRVTAELARGRPEDEGVILASGGESGGFVLYVLGDRLVFEHRFLGEARVATSRLPVPLGETRVGYELTPLADGRARVRLHLDGAPVGETELPLTVDRPSFWGLDIGRDAVTRVSPAYASRGDFAFPDGALRRVALEVLDAAPTEAVAQAALASQ